MTDDTDEFAAFVCGVQRIADHRKEQRQIAETLVEGVPLDRLRAIRDAGGLAKLLEAFDGLHRKLGRRLSPSGDRGRPWLPLITERIAPKMNA